MSCILYCASTLCNHLLINGLSMLLLQFVVPAVVYGVVIHVRRQSVSFGVSGI